MDGLWMVYELCDEPNSKRKFKIIMSMRGSDKHNY